MNQTNIFCEYHTPPYTPIEEQTSFANANSTTGFTDTYPMTSSPADMISNENQPRRMFEGRIMTTVSGDFIWDKGWHRLATPDPMPLMEDEPLDFDANGFAATEQEATEYDLKGALDDDYGYGPFEGSDDRHPDELGAPPRKLSIAELERRVAESARNIYNGFDSTGHGISSMFFGQEDFSTNNPTSSPPGSFYGYRVNVCSQENDYGVPTYGLPVYGNPMYGNATSTSFDNAYGTSSYYPNVNGPQTNIHQGWNNPVGYPQGLGINTSFGVNTSFGSTATDDSMPEDAKYNFNDAYSYMTTPTSPGFFHSRNHSGHFDRFTASDSTGLSPQELNMLTEQEMDNLICWDIKPARFTAS